MQTFTNATPITYVFCVGSLSSSIAQRGYSYRMNSAFAWFVRQRNPQLTGLSGHQPWSHRSSSRSTHHRTGFFVRPQCAIATAELSGRHQRNRQHRNSGLHKNNRHAHGRSIPMVEQCGGQQSWKAPADIPHHSMGSGASAGAELNNLSKNNSHSSWHCLLQWKF